MKNLFRTFNPFFLNSPLSLVIGLVMASLIHLPSFAYFSTMDTATTLSQGQFLLSPELEFITNPDAGINIGTKFDGAIDDETGYRAMVGFGEASFHFGGFIKWIPIPDIDNQPGIGLLAGVTYGSYRDVNELSVRLHPLISKKLRFEFGDLTPYGSLPFGLTSRDDKTVVPMQIAAGSTFRPDSLEKLSFGAEIGFDVTKAYSYFSLFMSFLIDEDGVEIR